MIPRTDGSAAKAYFAHLAPDTAEALREAIVEAIAKCAVLATEAAVLAAPQSQETILQAAERNVAPIENTALDVAASVLAKHWPPAKGGPNIGAAIAAGTVGAVAAGVSIGKVRGSMYRAGSVLGDVEAAASGNPAKVVRRAGQHVFWRAFGKLGRGIFRGIGGGK